MTKTLKEIKEKIDKIVGMKSTVVKGSASYERLLRYKTRTGVSILDIRIWNDKDRGWTFVGWYAPGDFNKLWRTLARIK